MDWFNYLIIPLIGFTSIGVFLYKKYAIYAGIISNPNYRTLHESPIPRGGGIVFSLLFILTIFFIWQYLNLSKNLLLMLGVGGAIASLFGFIDDIKGIRAGIKLIFQLFISSWTLLCLHSDNLLLLNSVPIFLIIPALLFFMVWIINAYNFMDGVDGMAASGAIFTSLTLSLVLFINGNNDELIPIFILIAGLVVGFIFFNWPPASIFMGDAGSIFLGFIFGSLLLFTTLNGSISIWLWLTVFGYFFADTTLTQILRVISIKKWYLPHRSHAYQNLARITGSHLKVTSAVSMYNIFWILPLTLLTVIKPEIDYIVTMFAIFPALVVAYKFGPILSSS